MKKMGCCFSPELYDDLLVISFVKEVYATDFFCDCHIIQSLFELHSYNGIRFLRVAIDLTKTIWFDTLSLCNLLMYLYKYKDELTSNKVNIYLYDDLVEFDDLPSQKKRFLFFLYDNGFINYINKIGCSEFIIPKNVNSTYSDIHSCLYQYNIIAFDEEEVENDKLIDVETQKVKQLILSTLGDKIDSSGLDYTISKVLYFIRETLENVYRHAYSVDNKHKICCILVKTVKSNKNLDLIEYREKYTEYTPYIDICLYEEKCEYFEIFVSDIGMGIRHSFLNDPDGKDANITDDNIIGYIFSNGQRSRKKIKASYKKTTKYGGLFDLAHMFSSDNDKLGIKGDSFWFFASQAQLINDDRKDRHDYNNLSHGFSVVGSISWKVSVKEHIKEILPFSPENELYFDKIYNEKNAWMIKDYKRSVTIYENRISNYSSELRSSTQAKTFVLLPEKFLSKKKLEYINYELINKNPNYELLLIADIPDEEMKKYFTLYSRAKVKVNKLIIISRTQSVAVFVFYKNELHYSKKQTNEFINNRSLNNFHINLGESLLSFRLWLKTYDSELIWTILSQSRKESYINATVKWGDIPIQGYLDFSQLCLVPACRQLCLQQLFRLQINEEKIYFKSVDRFTDEICEHANKLMDNSVEGSKYLIGSVFVTGISNQAIYSNEPDSKVFYFFQHKDSTNIYTDKKIYSLFEWATIKTKIDIWFPPRVKDKEYKRIGRTSFIAASGAEYWMSQHYCDMTTVYQNTQDKTYDILQRRFGYRPPIMKLGHYDLEVHHDLFEIDYVTLFEADMIKDSKITVLKDSSYDYLLTRIYSAINTNPDLNEVENAIANKALPTDREAAIRKIKEFIKMNSNNSKEIAGLLVYLYDYQISQVVEPVKNLFSPDMQERFIPIIPIVKNHSASALLISPLIIESLRGIIEKYKKENDGYIEATIFIATTTSTRLRKELKHIMFRLGISAVKTLTIFDRQRFPMGTYGNTHSHTAYSRLDLPDMGLASSCSLCRSLISLISLKPNLRDSNLRLRLSKIGDIWNVVKTTDNHHGNGVMIEEIQLPEKIHNAIERFSLIYNQESININTNLGLAMFSIENTVASLTTDFLDECLADKSGLEPKIKMLLISVHLLLFNEIQISERHLYNLTEQLCGLLKIKDGSDAITALSLIAIIAQKNAITKKLLQYIILQDYKKNRVDQINNNDYLLLKLYMYVNYSEVISEEKTHADFKSDLSCYCLYEMNKVELIYNWLLYTEPNYVQSHFQAYSQILRLKHVQPFVYKKAIEFTCYLKELLLCGKLNEKLFNDIDIYIDNINEIYHSLDTLLFELQNSQIGNFEDAKGNSAVNNSLKNFLSVATILNRGLFLSTTSKESIETWLKFCVKKAQERIERVDDIALSVSISIANDESWFYAFSDVTEEVVNLIVDMCLRSSHKMKNLFVTTDNKDYVACIKVEFQADEKREKTLYSKISFYNWTTNNVSLQEIKKIKRSKRDRPSMLVFDQFQDRLNNIDPSLQCFEWDYYEDVFIDIEHSCEEHLLKATMIIPCIDMGSASVKKKKQEDEEVG